MPSMLINGELVPAASGATFTIYNPASEEVVDAVPQASAEDARHTEAAFTSTASHSTSGAVNVIADATNVAAANAPGGTLGLAGITSAACRRRLRLANACGTFCLLNGAALLAFLHVLRHGPRIGWR